MMLPVSFIIGMLGRMKNHVRNNEFCIRNEIPEIHHVCYVLSRHNFLNLLFRPVEYAKINYTFYRKTEDARDFTINLTDNF